MAFITSPQILRIKNAADTVVVGVARTLKFIGGIVVTDAGDAEAVIDGTGAAGNPWDVLGNAGGGLVLGTNTADSWDMIVNSVRTAGFDASGQFDVAGKNILSLAANPTAGAGIPAAIGSVGLRNNGGLGELWIKTGAADTAWTISTASVPSGWLTSLNALTGGSPVTPNESLGSSNDYDIVFERNSAEIMRLITDTTSGLLIGGSTHIGTTAAKLELQTVANGQVNRREALTVGGFSAVGINRLARLDTVGAASASTDFVVSTGVVQLIKINVSARQSSGGTGSVGDGAGFIINVTANNNGGVASILDQVAEYTYAIDPGITVGVTAVGASVRVTCTGVAGRNLRWGINTDALNIT